MSQLSLSIPRVFFLVLSFLASERYLALSVLPPMLYLYHSVRDQHYRQVFLDRGQAYQIS